MSTSDILKFTENWETLRRKKISRIPRCHFKHQTWNQFFIPYPQAKQIFFSYWTEPVGFAFNFEWCSELQSVQVIPFFTPVTSKPLNVNIVWTYSSHFSNKSFLKGLRINWGPGPVSSALCGPRVPSCLMFTRSRPRVGKYLKLISIKHRDGEPRLHADHVSWALCHVTWWRHAPALTLRSHPSVFTNHWLPSLLVSRQLSINRPSGEKLLSLIYIQAMGSFYSRYLNLFASDQGGYGTIDNIKFQITLNMSQHNIERLRLIKRVVWEQIYWESSF